MLACGFLLDLRSLIRHFYHEVMPAGQVVDAESRRQACGFSLSGAALGADMTAARSEPLASAASFA